METIKKRHRADNAAAFLSDILRGALIGIAFIIPGFSGGSVAAVLGIYERLVGAISDLPSHPARSARTLLPIAFGGLLGAAALILPIRRAMEVFPLPTVSLFVGLALGGLPVLKSSAGKPNGRRFLLFLLAAAAAVSLLFLPAAEQPDGFLYDLDFGGYILLFLVGFAAACALVVPGISGSMILLIFGYYTPLVDLLTEFFLFGRALAISICVILVALLGMIFGALVISSAMKWLLRHCPHGTYFAILGFILGSVAAVYAPILRSGQPISPLQWVCAAAMLFVGFLLAYAFVRLTRRMNGRKMGPSDEARRADRAEGDALGSGKNSPI